MESLSSLLLARRIALVGNAGGGKSTLAKQLSRAMGVRAIHIDEEQWVNKDLPLPEQEFRHKHDTWLQEDEWIIDGFGTKETFFRRLEVAEAILFVDLCLSTHLALVTKRAILAYLFEPVGWPARSLSIADLPEQLRFTVRVHRRWTSACREIVKQHSLVKPVLCIRSLTQLRKVHQEIAHGQWRL